MSWYTFHNLSVKQGKRNRRTKKPQERKYSNDFLRLNIYFQINSIERDKSCAKAFEKELITHTNLRVLKGIQIKEGVII